ncbi:MAG TPA: serine hydrolase domain-containing protein [Hyphomonadaceae bacterium]|nr:serine hydrolase domain-containing protein [Hyphomonadaceae bacterium]
MASTTLLMKTLQGTALALTLALASCASGPKTVDPSESSIVQGDAAQLGFDPGKLNDIRVAYNADVMSGKIPGAYLLIGRHDKVAFQQGFGVQGPGQTTPASDQTIYRVFSMTKPIVAVTAMTLVQEGKLNLDDPVSKYIPEFANVKVLQKDGTQTPATKPILIRQLMSHTSGLIYGFVTAGQPISKIWIDGGEMRSDLTAKDLSAQVFAKLPLIAEPGAAWNYSHGLDVLGGVIEVITKKPLDVAVKERVTGPLGMTDTAFYQPKEKSNRFAQPKDAGSLIAGVSLYYDYASPTPYMQGGGGISSTAEDYLRFVLMLAHKGTYQGVQILKPETVDLMLVDQTTAEIRGKGLFFPGQGLGFGLGMSLVIDDTKTKTTGNGTFSWNGVAGTEWWYDPKNDLFMIFMQQDRALLAEYQRKNRTMIYDALKK